MFVKKMVLMPAVVFFFVAWHGFAAGVERYAATNGAGGTIGPFTTWATAGSDLKTVVDWANSNNANDIVWVSNGVYSLNEQINVSNTQVKGWSGSYTDVVINGNNSAGKPITNRCFYLNHASALVAGLTVSNGYSFREVAAGAGLYVQIGTVSNCLITCNVASNPIPYGESGYGTPRGVAIYLNTSSKVVACVVRNNSTVTAIGGGTGGAIYINSSGQVLDSVIEDNYCEYAPGGIAVRSGGIVSNCIVRGNVGRYNSGGILMDEDGGKVYDSFVINNSSRDSARGVGVWLRCRAGLVQNCVITGNFCNAATLPNFGGGVGTIASGSWPPTNTMVLRNCLIARNLSAYGGGIFATVTCLVENCSIVDNSSTAYGGGLYVSNTLVNINNSIIYFNAATTGGSNWFLDTAATCAFTNCCLNPTNDIAGSENIAGDPLLTDRFASDYRLTPKSPCVNAGANQEWMWVTGAVDRDGRPRIDRFSGIVDIGCYEYLYRGMLVGF